ncbi:MAG TPA: ATP-dependent protease, partial [Myxococcales bacterium]|nr:ATP-dependent protease [Myxococcales bacterium]
MSVRVLSGAVLGIDAYKVDVEVDMSNGMPSFDLVGLAEGAIKESRVRVRSA